MRLPLPPPRYLWWVERERNRRLEAADDDNVKWPSFYTTLRHSTIRGWLPTFNVRLYGAVGNNTTDDTVAFQRAIDAAADAGGGTVTVPPGSYLLGSNQVSLFLYGNVSLAGVHGTSTITVDGAEVRSGRANFIACGVKSDKTHSNWEGRIEGLRFVPGSNIGQGTAADVTRIINVYTAEDYWIVNNRFEDFEDDVQCIKGGSDSDWMTVATGVRNRGRYIGNTMDLNQTTNGGEQISVSAASGSSDGAAQDIMVVGNHVEGCGDDPIALHCVTGAVVHGNRCKSLDGRILVVNTSQAVISDNVCEHTSAAGGSSHIYVGASADSGTRICHDITVIGNRTRILPDQDVANTIRLLGVWEGLVTGNMVQNESHKITNISVEAVTVSSVDYESGRVTVEGNTVNGGRIRVVQNQAHDWVRIGPNTIDGAGLFGGSVQKLVHFDGDEVYAGGTKNVYPGGDIIDVRHGGDVADAMLVGTWEYTGLPASGNTTLTRLGSNAFTTVTCPTTSGTAHGSGHGLGWVPVLLNITLDSSAGGNTATVELMHNGSAIGAVDVLAADGTGFAKSANVTVGAEEPLGNCGFIRPGDTLGVRTVDGSGDLNGLDIQVEVYAVRCHAVSDDEGDAAVTLQCGVDPWLSSFHTTLTANRVVTLSTTNAVKGARFRVVRSATTPGAFTLDVGGLQTIPTNTRGVVDVEYNGSAWALTKYSALA